MSNFICLNCQKPVSEEGQIGTAHRNHCPFCLWSRHIDQNREGDRKAKCQAAMTPIGLTFKKEKPDKYDPQEKGEIMLVHRCLGCGKISINRIAADDNAEQIMNILEKPERLDKKTVDLLTRAKIRLAGKGDEKQIRLQLFGLTK